MFPMTSCIVLCVYTVVFHIMDRLGWDHNTYSSYKLAKLPAPWALRTCIHQHYTCSVMLLNVYMMSCYCTVIPASSDELLLSSVSSSQILSTRSCLLHLVKAFASFLYVAFAPRFCFHCFSIACRCARTARGCDSITSSTSTSVRLRKGAMSCHCAIFFEIKIKCFSEQSCFHLSGRHSAMMTVD